MSLTITSSSSVRFGPDEVNVDFANRIIELNGHMFTFDFLEQMFGAKFHSYSFERDGERLHIHTIVPKRTLEKAHPEDICNCCGGKNVAWHAPSPIWNQVMRDVRGVDSYNGIVCPRCFTEIAKNEGIDVSSWCLTIHEEDRWQLKSVNSGLSMRIFDWVKCLWQEETTS